LLILALVVTWALGLSVFQVLTSVHIVVAVMTQFPLPDPKDPNKSLSLSLPESQADLGNLLPKRKSLYEQLSGLADFHEQFMKSIESVVSIDERSSPGVVSPQHAVAQILNQLLLLEREKLEVQQQAASQRLISLIAASAQLVNPLIAYQSESSLALRLEITEHVLASAALVAKTSLDNFNAKEHYLDALVTLSLAGQIKGSHFSKLRDHDSEAIISLLDQAIIDMRNEGFPHALPNNDLEPVAHRLLAFALISSTLKLYQLYDQFDDLLRDVHAWNAVYSPFYGMMGGMTFGYGTDDASFSLNQYAPESEVDRDDSFADLFSGKSSHSFQGNEFSVYNFAVINQMEDLMLVVVNNLANLSDYLSVNDVPRETSDFLIHVLEDYRIGWVGWAPCMSALLRLSEQGYEEGQKIFETRLLPQLLLNDTTAHYTLCKLISRDACALQMVVSVVKELDSKDRSKFFELIDRNERDLGAEYQRDFAAVLQKLSQLARH